jgi:hypothetical protein
MKCPATKCLSLSSLSLTNFRAIFLQNLHLLQRLSTVIQELGKYILQLRPGEPTSFCLTVALRYRLTDRRLLTQITVFFFNYKGFSWNFHIRKSAIDDSKYISIRWSALSTTRSSSIHQLDHYAARRKACLPGRHGSELHSFPK